MLKLDRQIFATANHDSRLDHANELLKQIAKNAFQIEYTLEIYMYLRSASHYPYKNI